MFSAATEATLQKLISTYPHKRSALIPMLLAAQREHGYVKPEAVEYVARLLDLSPSDVDSVISFYILLHRQPVGKYHIQVCTNLSCMLLGSDRIEDVLKNKLGIGMRQTTPDGLFSLEEAECLGSCTTAPVLQVNREFCENLDPRKVEALIDELRNRP